MAKTKKVRLNGCWAYFNGALYFRYERDVFCPHCEGAGEFAVCFTVEATPASCSAEKKCEEAGYKWTPLDSNAFPKTVDCQMCCGLGVIPFSMMLPIVQGARLMASRLQLGFGLRRFAEMVGMNPSTVSMMEHGLIDPSPLLEQLR